MRIQARRPAQSAMKRDYMISLTNEQTTPSFHHTKLHREYNYCCPLSCTHSHRSNSFQRILTVCFVGDRFVRRSSASTADRCSPRSRHFSLNDARAQAQGPCRAKGRVCRRNRCIEGHILPRSDAQCLLTIKCLVDISERKKFWTCVPPHHNRNASGVSYELSGCGASFQRHQLAEERAPQPHA